ncbi:glycosyl hydrolase-related protein, partial [Rhizobium ruizarguesonis]
HEGAWHEGGVLDEAIDLNKPLVSAESSGLSAGTFAPLAISGIHVAFSGLKPAEEGDGLIMRLYEPAGRRGSLAHSLPSGLKVS